MEVYPSAAEAKLGFTVLLEHLADYVLSPPGLDRLEAMRPSGRPDWIRAELARVAEVQDALRFDDPIPFRAVPDVRALLPRLAPSGAYIAPEDLYAVGIVLATSRLLQRYFVQRAGRYPQVGGFLERLVALPDLEARIAAVVDDEGRVRDDASPELRRIRQEILQRQAQLRDALMRALRHAVSQGYATEDQPTIRNGRMVIPVRAEAKRKVQGFVHDVSSTGQTVYIEPAASLDLNNDVRELEAAERREVERILREAAGRLRAHLDDLRANVSGLADYELLQAKARLSNRLDAVVPELAEDGSMALRQARNPVLQLRFARTDSERTDAGGTDADGTERSAPEAGPRRTYGAGLKPAPTDLPRHVVPLDLNLGDTATTLVITGPNAGGKTVAMKTVGLLSLMLSYGLPVPVAPASRCGLFARLIVDIGDEQSIEEDLSTFSSHVKNLKYMIEHADAGTLVLIDEASTGTDPAEGGALAQAVLEHLTRVGARTIVTTHHGTLKAFAHETEGVENGSMQFDRENLSPTYYFQAGVPGSSYAFEIASRIGLPDAVLERARALVGTGQVAMETLIATFEARNLELAERLEQITREQAEARSAKANYDQLRGKLKEDEEAIRLRALQEAEAVIQGANARIERTIREIREGQAEKEATRALRAELDAHREEIRRQKETAERRRESRARQTYGAGLKPAPTGPQRRAEPGERSGPLRVGDQVVLDDGSTTAELLELDGNEAVITFGSMRSRVKTNRLTKVGGPRKQQVTIRQSTAGGDSGVASLGARQRIDLRGQRVDEALQEVMRFLDAALSANLAHVEILHGKGTGALRLAIQEYLESRPDVAGYEEAPPDQGGAGVTYVTLQ